MYLDWWAEFLPAFNGAHPDWSHARRPQPANSIALPSGRSGVHYGIGFAWPTGATNYSLRAEVFLRDGAAAYRALESQRAALDGACTLNLQWEPIDNARASRVAAYLDPVDPADRESWPTYRAWAIEALGELRRVFAGPIRNLP